MRRKRRNHSPSFKAKVALAALKGDLTMAELIKKYDVHANQISDWKKQLLEGAEDVFGKWVGLKNIGGREFVGSADEIIHRYAQCHSQPL